MTRHVKAASAGSTRRRAHGIGKFDRAEAAVWGLGLGVKGRGAPLLSLCAAAFLLSLIAPAGAAAIEPPSQLETTGPAPRLDTSARLNARVNPEGENLEYTFEFSSDNGNTWQSLGAHLDTSNANVPIVISQELTELQPSTSYVFRVEVENSAGGSLSDERTFTTRTVAEVTPPNRGYELVNNPDKGNQNAATPIYEGNGWQSPITADGNEVTWVVNGGAPGGFNQSGSLFLAERTPAGWKSRSVVPPPAEQIGGGSWEYKLMFHDPTMSHFIASAARPTFFGEAEETGFARLGDSQNQEILGLVPSYIVRSYLTATNDFQHVLFVDGHFGGQIIDIGSGTPEIVSIMPDGTPSECEVLPGVGFGGSAGVSAGAGGMFGQIRNKVHMNTIDEADASIVYFETKENGECGATYPNLYVRDRDTEETTMIAPGIPDDPEMIEASPDGHFAYFVSGAELDSNDANTTRDIYRWDDQTQEPSCLTCAVATEAQVNGVVALSEDLSTMYFESPNALVPGKGVPGGQNVYMLRNGGLRFVATVTGAPGVQFFLAKVSKDGTFFAFPADSNRQTTSDAVVSECGVTKAEPQPFCEQLYLYDAEEESLECVACDRGGTTKYAAPGVSRWDMSDNGVIAVGTLQALIPSDINNANDIYEVRNGVQRLVTDGESSFAENLASSTSAGPPLVHAITPEGGTILYTAPERTRTGYEQDGFANLYAARIGGGFPRPSAPSHCSEESCQGSLAVPPTEESIGSSVVQGPGNIGAGKARCRKARARRKGRCVKQRHSRQHHRRAHSRAKGGGK